MYTSLQDSQPSIAEARLAHLSGSPTGDDGSSSGISTSNSIRVQTPKPETSAAPVDTAACCLGTACLVAYLASFPEMVAGTIPHRAGQDYPFCACTCQAFITADKSATVAATAAEVSWANTVALPEEMEQFQPWGAETRPWSSSCPSQAVPLKVEGGNNEDEGDEDPIAVWNEAVAFADRVHNGNESSCAGWDRVTCPPSPLPWSATC